MSLVAGTRLGPYEIQSAIGAGGMGEVYKARDTRLDRTVAIKILPAELSADPDRRTRFEREARAIAALNHPHICTLHDIGTHDGATYLVMEHLAGQSLAERLLHGPLPLAQALDVAAQIAEALDAAHKHGIIHRDLKPGNVMLTSSGAGRSGVVTAKLLDFGLAKLAAHGERPAIESQTHMPTQAAPVTAQGTILGTLQYMAPEQLEGKEADARADLWALGAILYEMLTGRRAFEGESQVSLIGNIMNAEPAALATLQPLTPPALDRVVRKCLAKHPDDRWGTAHDVADELRWLASGSGATSVVRPSATSTSRRAAFWVIGTLLAGAGLSILLWPLVPRAQPSPRTSMWLAIALPPEMPLAPAGLVSPSHDRPALALSPDGTRLAYVALVGGETRLCVRDMQTGKVSALDHTAAAHTPFFSPDGAWIGFFADNKLKKVSVGGGETTTLAEAPNPWGASWAPDDRIYFNRYEGEGVFRVGARGGAPVEAVLAGGSDAGLMPEFNDAGPGLFVDGVRYIDLRGPSPVSRRVISGNRARYVSSGHLVYNSGSALMAVPFDASTMAPIGDSVTLLEDLRTANYGVAQFTVSREGTLVYVSGRPQGLTSFVLVNRHGIAERLDLPEAEYGAYSLSPDGKHLAYALDSEIWVWNRERRTSVRLSPRPTIGTAARNMYPRWAPDGQTVVYSSTTAGSGARLLAAPVDGRPPVELWADKDEPWLLYPMRFSPDGSVLSAFRRGRDSSFDLYLLRVSASGSSLAAAGKPEIFLGERFGECFGQISPDGRWMLFSSDQGGTYEIWATTYPTAGPRYRVSKGREAMWNPAVPGEVVVVDGRAVYAVDVTRGPAQPGNRQFLFDGPYPDTTGFGYDMTPDGRFLMLQNEDILKPATTLTVVTNFLDELGRRVPPRRR